MYWGFGVGVLLFGIKSGMLGFWSASIIYSTSMINYVLMSYTSFQKVKDLLKYAPKPFDDFLKEEGK